MSHTLEVDHSKSRGSLRRIERTADGRIVSAETRPPAPGQYEDLGRELARAVDGEVRFDSGDRALYATDASNYRQVPLGVVIPRSAAAIARTVELCRKFEAPDPDARRRDEPRRPRLQRRGAASISRNTSIA